MPKLFSYTIPLAASAVDAFCNVQKGFTDQFVYYRKDKPKRFFGLGRCIAVSNPSDLDSVIQGPCHIDSVLFQFNRFDAANPKPTDDLFASFPQVPFMVPELVIMELDSGVYLQVNSLGPVYLGRVERFARKACEPISYQCACIPYSITPDDPDQWERSVSKALAAIQAGKLEKIVLSRRVGFHAKEPFSSKDVVLNLINGSARGCVFMYRYGDVFFCGCTPELLVSVEHGVVESECLAGTIQVGKDEKETAELGQALLIDEKNRAEHDFVVQFIRHVFERNCYDVYVPEMPRIKVLPHIQHLQTPVSAKLMEGRHVEDLSVQLMPTPALSGAPVGEALMLLREIEPYNRGLFGGSAGVVFADGSGEYSVTIRSGVFDGQDGWLYAGCGIVSGSDALAEYNEIEMKLKTIRSAFEGDRS